MKNLNLKLKPRPSASLNPKMSAVAVFDSLKLQELLKLQNGNST